MGQPVGAGASPPAEGIAARIGPVARASVSALLLAIAASMPRSGVSRLVRSICSTPISAVSTCWLDLVAMLGAHRPLLA